jgi:hypothetical protein
MDRACFEPFVKDGGILAYCSGIDKKQCLKLKFHPHGRAF